MRLASLLLLTALLSSQPGPAEAQQTASTPLPGTEGLIVAVMPAQYFSADAESAARLTESLRQDFSSKGWRVVPPEAVKIAWDEMGLEPSRHYADQTAIELGRKLNANLVVYPRLLALGVPIVPDTPSPGTPVPAVDRMLPTTELMPAAVVHLRVLNVARNKPIYFNQIAHEVSADRPFQIGFFEIPTQVAQTATAEVLGGFYQRVAGTREVLGPDPKKPSRPPTPSRR